jgi:hypothetical protein
VGCLHLAQVTDQWQVLENTVMDLQVPENVGNFFTTLATISFLGGQRSMELLLFTQI